MSCAWCDLILLVSLGGDGLNMFVVVALAEEKDMQLFVLERSLSASDPLGKACTILECMASPVRIVLYWLPALPSRQVRDFWKAAILYLLYPLHAEQYNEI